jgi:hypothetical protein
MSKRTEEQRPMRDDRGPETGPGLETLGDWDEIAQALARLPWRHARRFFRALGRHCRVAGHDVEQLSAAIESELAAAWGRDHGEPGEP